MSIGFSFETIRRIAAIAAVFSIVSLLNIGCGDPPWPDTYRVSGTITGDGVVGVTITISGDPTGADYKYEENATTDADGNYSFEYVRNGEYIVTPSLSGHVFTKTEEEVIVADGDEEDVNFVSSAVDISDTEPPEPSPSTWAVPPTATGPTTITMTAKTAGDPSGGIKYQFYNVNTEEASAWQDFPTYVATDLTPGTEYEFAVRSRDDLENTGRYSGKGAATTPLDIVTTFSISGTVSGHAAEDVLIEISGPKTDSTETDRAGDYSFSGLEAGTYTLTPSLEGFTFTDESETVTIIDADRNGVNFTSHAEWPNSLTRPRRTILFIIDAMPSRLHERIAMPELSDLISEGVLYEEVHVPLPDHPEQGDDYPWSCSLPNPVLMSGTVFIGQPGIKDALLQHSFTERATCFYVNANSYEAISHDYTDYQMVRGPWPDRYKDERPIEAGKAAIKEPAIDPAYIRIHCQGPGMAGHASRVDEGEPYYQNVWHPDSLFISQNQYVDTLLGEFVDWLKTENLWESSVLLVMGDHGEAEEGGHDPYSPDTSLTQLIVAGGAVKEGVTFEYAENIDIAPTIAWLQDVPAPEFSDGRVLSEIIKEIPEPDHVDQRMKNLNDALVEHHEMAAGGDTPKFYTIEEIGIWHTSEHGADYEDFVDYQLRTLTELKER